MSQSWAFFSSPVRGTNNDHSAYDSGSLSHFETAAGVLSAHQHWISGLAPHHPQLSYAFSLSLKCTHEELHILPNKVFEKPS